MATPLRFDSRVELHEKTDIFTVIARSHSKDPSFVSTLIPEPDVILADVSFISLKTVLVYAKSHLASPHTDLLVMCKPQFEASSRQLTRGVVKNSATRRAILANFESWLKANHFLVIKKRDNQLPGRAGNLERFYWLRISR